MIAVVVTGASVVLGVADAMVVVGVTGVGVADDVAIVGEAAAELVWAKSVPSVAAQPVSATVATAQMPRPRATTPRAAIEFPCADE
ncbi:hypothetical protein [Nocardia sp. AG03]|uniref:hypothetical protein n=1 Tax=Nocardia sp. AG03 TaxID=3025312 RepID=UPI002418A0FE|nr:hypothetical protein [Nocardia sp. AG03]